MLDQRHTFIIEVFAEPIEECQEFFATDPAPGIDPLPDAKVIKITPSGYDPEVAFAHVEMSIEDFIRQSIQYNIDPYEILKEIRNTCGSEAATAAHAFLSNATDLTTTQIDTTDGHLTTDTWPTKPEL